MRLTPGIEHLRIGPPDILRIQYQFPVNINRQVGTVHFHLTEIRIWGIVTYHLSAGVTEEAQ